ncbi:MAG: hypothetical protein WC614_08350 [bacterium]
MKKYLILFIILTATNLFASAPDTLWTRTYGGTEGDEGWSAQQTSDSGFIITGYTNSFGAGNGDVYLIKTNSSGDTLWTRTFGGTSSDNAHSVQQTFDSGFIVAGSEGTGGVYLIKTNSSGDTLWTKTYGGNDMNWGNSVQQTSDSGFIITGGTFSFGVGTPNYSNVYLIRTNFLGNTIWTKTYGGPYGDCGTSVQQTADGGFIITGTTLSVYGGVYLIKTNSSGDTVWTKTFGGTSTDCGYSVQQTFDSGFVVTGTTHPFGAGGGDVYLVKTNSLGDTLWTRTFGGTSSDVGYSVRQTQDSGFIITGYTSSFGISGNIYLIKTNSSGDTVWTKTFGGTTYAFGHSVQQTADGGFIIAGTTNSFGAGGGDVYLIRLGKETGVEEPSILDRGLANLDLKIVKDKISLSLPNNYYPNTLLTIYDLTGRPKETLYSGTLSKGDYTFTPNIHKSGVYFVRLTAVCHSDTERSEGEESNIITETKKLILVK